MIDFPRKHQLSAQFRSKRVSGIRNEGTENRTENSTIDLYINLRFVYMWSTGAVLVTSSVPPKTGYGRI